MDKHRWVVGEVTGTSGKTLCLLTQGCTRSAVLRIHTNHVTLTTNYKKVSMLCLVSVSIHCSIYSRSESCFVLQGFTQISQARRGHFKIPNCYLCRHLPHSWMVNCFIFLLFKIPTTDVDLSVLASTPLPKPPDKTSAELEETKVALKELQRHFETYKTERTQAEE